MTKGVEVAGLYVRDQDEALAFYVEKLGFRVDTDVRRIRAAGVEFTKSPWAATAPWTPASATPRATGGK